MIKYGYKQTLTFLELILIHIYLYALLVEGMGEVGEQIILSTNLIIIITLL